MAANIDVTPGTGKTVGTDEVSSVQYQIVKLGVSATGVAPTQVSAAAPMPMQIYASASTPLTYNPNGIASRANSAPVVLADISSGEYETVAASQTAQVLGVTGGTGDYVSGLLVIPATTSPGNVLLLDNATSITVFTGGSTSVSNLVPFFIPLGMYSVSGAWKVTTGANVSVIGIGNFT